VPELVGNQNTSWIRFVAIGYFWLIRQTLPYSFFCVRCSLNIFAKAVLPLAHPRRLCPGSAAPLCPLVTPLAILLHTGDVCLTFVRYRRES